MSLSVDQHSVLNVRFHPSGQTFWERHEALTAANPPTSEGPCVLIALKWTVKEPSWYLGVFLWRNVNKKKSTRWTGFIKRVWKKKKHEQQKKVNWKKLSYGNWSKMPLQHIKYRWWGTVCWRGILAASPFPVPSMCVYSVKICLLL